MVMAILHYAQDYWVYVLPLFSRYRKEHSDLNFNPFPSSSEENWQRRGP
jgi:hypothetical protein